MGTLFFLRLETGSEQEIAWLIRLCYGSTMKRSSLVFMRWSNIDHGAKDLKEIQRPILFLVKTKQFS
jgi:hypothetical protein